MLNIYPYFCNSFSDTPTLPNGQTMPLVNEDDLRQVTILSKPDWERIQYQLNRRAIEEEKRRQIKEEKEKMAATSKEMVKNWSNTIAVRIYHFFQVSYCMLGFYVSLSLTYEVIQRWCLLVAVAL